MRTRGHTTRASFSLFFARLVVGGLRSSHVTSRLPLHTHYFALQCSLYQHKAQEYNFSLVVEITLVFHQYYHCRARRASWSKFNPCSDLFGSQLLQVFGCNHLCFVWIGRVGGVRSIQVFVLLSTCGDFLIFSECNAAFFSRFFQDRIL